MCREAYEGPSEPSPGVGGYPPGRSIYQVTEQGGSYEGKRIETSEQRLWRGYLCFSFVSLGSLGDAMEIERSWGLGDIPQQRW